MITRFNGKSFNQKIAISVGAFLVNVIVFALFYWMAWLWNPDTFIVQEEVNLFPIRELRALWELQSPDDISQYISYSAEGLDDLYPSVEEVKRKLADIDTKSRVSAHSLQF